MLGAKRLPMQIRVSCGLITELDSPLLKIPGGDEHGRGRNSTESDPIVDGSVRN